MTLIGEAEDFGQGMLSTVGLYGYNYWENVSFPSDASICMVRQARTIFFFFVIKLYYHFVMLATSSAASVDTTCMQHIFA
jgi:hypothetical protein